MTLVDTSVWIDFLRGAPRAAALGALLEAGELVIHPWIIGELALGHLGTHRLSILSDLRQLPSAPVLNDDEVLQMIDARNLAGSGLGWVDAHLLGSALLAKVTLWSFDSRLVSVAASLGLPSSPR